MQFIIVIGAILLGTRYGGMGIGTVSYTHLTLPTSIVV